MIEQTINDIIQQIKDHTQCTSLVGVKADKKERLISSLEDIFKWDDSQDIYLELIKVMNRILSEHMLIDGNKRFVAELYEYVKFMIIIKENNGGEFPPLTIRNNETIYGRYFIGTDKHIAMEDYPSTLNYYSMGLFKILGKESE